MSSSSIAVVDDDVSVRRSLSRLLKARGFEVTTYLSGEDFLARPPNETSPDCIVLDIHLPGMSGLELRKTLVAQRMNIPVVFITALDDTLAADTQHTGAPVACLLKPFEQTALIRSIAQAIELRSTTSSASTAS